MGAFRIKLKRIKNKIDNKYELRKLKEATIKQIETWLNNDLRAVPKI